MDAGIIAVVIAAISAAVAVWAKVDSGIANGIARDAVTKAERANEISAESNTISLAGNDIAVAANVLAEKTHAATLASGELQKERNDVVWKGSWVQYGILQLSNVGQDQALNVRAVVTLEGHERIQTADAVGDPLVFDFEHLAHKREADVLEEKDRRGRSYPVYSFQPPDLGISMFFRVTWHSELDRPCSQEGKQWFGSDEVLGR